jgi:splicing factor U2AF 35 kDa subunit
MGACRHGDRCSRAHNRPVFSQTLCLPHFYQNPNARIVAANQQGLPPPDITPGQIQEEFEDFYEEVFEELGKYGELEELHVCDNLGDHMIGTCISAPVQPCCFSLLSFFPRVSKVSIMPLGRICGILIAGNVYAKFFTEEDAMEALKGLNGRFYAGRQIVAEFSPVTEFREARCRQFDESHCSRGAFCNFMHLKAVPKDIVKDLMRNQPHYGENKREKSPP